jgi:hypothetical protein
MALALDEAVWKSKCMAKFGSRIAKDYSCPPDQLWRAEYCERKEAVRREEFYMNQLSQGRVGKLEAKKPRLVGKRYSAAEGMESHKAAELARSMYSLRVSEPGKHLEGMSVELHGNIDRASRTLSPVGRRQGSATWTVFRSDAAPVAARVDEYLIIGPPTGGAAPA